MMMSLGLYVFALETTAYQELRRRTSWRHGQTSRVGARPASQFLGPDLDVVSLSGWMGPELCGSPASIDQLRAMGDGGDAQPLVTGVGEVLGDFVIEDVEETQTVFFADGRARRIDFSINLRRVDDGVETGPTLADWDFGLAAFGDVVSV